MTQDKETVLILGAKGNLGMQLTAVFSQDSHYKIIAWDRGEIDITDRELILKKVGDIRPDIIINAAAYNAVDKCEDSEEEYDKAKKVNIDGPKYLAEAALELDAILVQYSTDYVFSGEQDNGYEEDDEPAPINRYGKTKFHGEKRILENSGSGLKWYIIRTSKLFGPKGESAEAKDSFFDVMSNLTKQNQQVKAVDGERSCFTYTPDLAWATKKLIESDKGYGFYHLTNSGSSTWYEAAVELFKLKNIDIKVEPIKSDDLARPAKRPKNSILLNTKFEQLRPWQEALIEFLKL